MPADERLRTDDRDDLQDRRKPSIQLDKEQAIAVGKPDAPFTIRCNTTTWCRSAAFSASSRLFDLNGETKTARTNTDRVLGTHKFDWGYRDDVIANLNFYRTPPY